MFKVPLDPIDEEVFKDLVHELRFCSGFKRAQFIYNGLRLLILLHGSYIVEDIHWDYIKNLLNDIDQSRSTYDT